MKKFKNYILMLLVPFILLGCVSKGVSDAVEEDTTLGGYTWDELEIMVNDGTYGVVKNIGDSTYGLIYIYNKTSNSNILTLESYLSDNVYKLIKDNSSSFNYNTAISYIEQKENTILSDEDIYTYDELVTIKEALTEFVSSTTSTLASNLITSIDGIIEKIDSAKSINDFYSSIYYLYLQSYGSTYGLKNSSITASLSSIGFNISDVLKNDSTIEEAYAELKTEIATLNSSTYKSYVVYLDSSLLTRMNDLSTLYSNYVSGNESYTNITNARTLVRSSDTTQLSKTMISFWATKIDEIYNALSTQTDLGNESTTVLAIIGHIDDYKALNTQYLNQNYNVIHSKTVNIIKEYVYLRTNYESYLLSEFGISFSSSSN